MRIFIKFFEKSTQKSLYSFCKMDLRNHFSNHFKKTKSKPFSFWFSFCIHIYFSIFSPVGMRIFMKNHRSSPRRGECCPSSGGACGSKSSKSSQYYFHTHPKNLFTPFYIFQLPNYTNYLHKVVSHIVLLFLQLLLFVLCL